ncbi:hypothetical protein [Glycomyces paridis]|uniref:Uncharacterized protein n=1 Tax=Glycomyces paridis TaxID=2126555 RepID=A0A4S8P2C5_9ACTN|nr:hypothetical protein [Glycomyces paridis]THV23461.1 hypothetical protein E9998_22930 [Glycomyces paridis]
MAAVGSAGLAVLSAAAAVVVLVAPADEETPAGEDQAGATESAEEIEAVDLTEGLDPFDPYANEDYYGVTWNDLAWVPPAPGEAWEVFYQEEARAVDFSFFVDENERATLNCGDLGDKAEHYPDAFDDAEAWYEGELDRQSNLSKEGDAFEVVAGPEYTHYRIDGQDAVLVEFGRHWTAYEDSEGAVIEVDFTDAQAYLYIDLPEDAGDGAETVTPVRCQLYVVSDDPAHYEAGLATVLGTRLWLE